MAEIKKNAVAAPSPDQRPYPILPDAQLDESDCHFWAKMPNWKPEEFIMLAVGRDPRRLTPEKVFDNPNSYSFSDDLYLVIEISSRDHKAMLLEAGRAPEWWIAWADNYEVGFPDRLRSAVAAKVQHHENRKSTALAKAGPAPSDRTREPIGARERDSLLKLIIGMAVGGYGYDPTASRSPIPAQIMSDLHKLALSLNDDTIRKYLKEAAELLPPPEAE